MAPERRTEGGTATADTEALNQAIDHCQRREWDEALAITESLIACGPDNAPAFHLTGQALLGRRRPGDIERCIEALHRANELTGGRGPIYNDLGTALWSQRRVEEALEAFLAAQKLDPTQVQAAFNAGNCCWLLGRFDAAEQHYRRAIALDADWARAHYMLGNCLVARGHPAFALDCYRSALACNSDLGGVHLAMSAALLKTGQWQEGWRSFASRLASDAYASLRDAGKPMWDGRQPQPGTLLVYGEQGIGDQLQFCRYLLRLVGTLDKVLLIADRGIHPLLARAGMAQAIYDKADRHTWPDSDSYDAWVPMMSLAPIYDQDWALVSGATPYLHSDETQRSRWQRRLSPDKPRIALVWSGNPEQKDNRYRSISPAALAPLGADNRLAFYSLQKGEAAEDALPDWIENLSADLRDFDDTAAAIACMDLVISVDTAVAHLAGALGKPVWTLLWTGSCWRYLEDREDSPWYPSMRLFRQSQCGDWDQVIEQVCRRLAQHPFVERS